MSSRQILSDRQARINAAATTRQARINQARAELEAVSNALLDAKVLLLTWNQHMAAGIRKVDKQYVDWHNRAWKLQRDVETLEWEIAELQKEQRAIQTNPLAAQLLALR